MSSCGGTCNIKFSGNEQSIISLSNFVKNTINNHPDYEWLIKYYDFDKNMKRTHVEN